FGRVGYQSLYGAGRHQDGKSRTLARNHYGSAGNLVRCGSDPVLYYRSVRWPRGRRSAWWAHPDRPGVRAGRYSGIYRSHPPDRRPVRFHWSLEPVSDSSSRWRSPFVLCDRGGPWATAVRASTGTWLPDWVGDRPHVDDFCNL